MLYNDPWTKQQLETTASVKDYIASLDDEQTAKDSEVLIEILQRISRREPNM
jgi:hypothetical protein